MGGAEKLRVDQSQEGMIMRWMLGIIGAVLVALGIYIMPIPAVLFFVGAMFVLSGFAFFMGAIVWR